MYKKGQKGKAKTELTNLCGDKLGNLDNSNFLSNILYLKDLYNKVLIYNATTFRRDLYENIQGDFKYPRTPVGAALISNAALLEQKEYNQLQNTRIFSSLPHYIGKLSCEGSKFYENLQRVIFPYWIQSRMEDEVGFGKQTIEQNNSYKRRSEALKEQALKEQALKTKTSKKKRPKRKTRGKTKVVSQKNTNLQMEIKEDQNDVLHPSTVDEKTPNNIEEIHEEKNSNRLNAKEDPNDVLHTSTVDEKTLNTTEEIGELEEEKISHTIIVDKVTPRAFSLFDTEGISNKYKNVLKSIYAYKMKDSKVKHKEAVEWNDVVNMMTNAFKGKMYGRGGPQN